MNDELEQLNRDYVRAVQESDVGWFEAHLSQDFLNTNPDASLVERAGFLAQIARPPGVTKLECHDVRIREMGDFAIIHAQTRYVKGDGQPGKGRYTDIWAREGGRWLCVAAHVARG
ncbi:MAG: nuclear transport factor 2 family protein [Burkholderiales bacterium]